MTSERKGWLRVAVQASIVAIVLFGGYLIYLDATVRERFEGRRWDLPGELYARPLELYRGEHLVPADLELELRALGYSGDGRLERSGHFGVSGDRISLHSRGFRFWDGVEAPRTVTITIHEDAIDELSDRDGKEVALVRLEPLLFARIHPAHPEDRVLVQLVDVPELLRNALLVVEDRDFYTHPGFEISAMVRALLVNLRAGEIAQGGSTITQQLVKNMFLTPRKSLIRKVNELLMAALLELHYSKAEILEAYLNEVYLAQDGNRAIHGFGLASEHFFAKPLKELDLSEIALLVAIVKGPSYYSPRANPERALERRNLVLDLLEQKELIDPDRADAAKRKPLGLRASSPTEFSFPAYVDLVRRELTDLYDPEELATHGLKIFTSLDPILQMHAQEAMERSVAALAKRSPELAQLEGAAVITSIAGGEVVAVVGGRRNVLSGFNRALDAVRPIGSLIKPAVYLTALESGAHTLLERISDAPITVNAGPNQAPWAPRNFDRRSHGDVILLDALVHSYNQATVRLGLEVGVRAVAQTVAMLGVGRAQPRVPSLLLGAGEMSPLDVSRMYLTIASNGFRKPLRSIRAVVSSSGTLKTRFPFAVERVVDPATSFLIDFALREVMTRGTGSMPGGDNPGRGLAGKTGTTDDYRDSWFAGYGAKLLAVVWLGRDDNRSTGLTGASGALPVWRALIASEKGRETGVGAPSSVIMVPIDPRTGEVATGSCAKARLIPFKRGTEPPGARECEKETRGLLSRVRRMLEPDAH